MQWFDAVRKSYSNMAERTDKNGICWVRSADGSGIKIIGSRSTPAYPEQLEGHLDWKPVCPKGKHGRRTGVALKYRRA